MFKLPGLTHILHVEHRIMLKYKFPKGSQESSFLHLTLKAITLSYAADLNRAKLFNFNPCFQHQKKGKMGSIHQRD